TALPLEAVVTNTPSIKFTWPRQNVLCPQKHHNNTPIATANPLSPVTPLRLKNKTRSQKIKKLGRSYCHRILPQKKSNNSRQ
ncbi:MAG: hypothetical protein M0O99_01415, partial [Desulfuromonas thiophila]|nr:hypothetical protein [Desulfuromonas thiophila]